MTTIGSWVRDARTHWGGSQEVLAKALDVTKGNVSAWENGRHKPKLEQILAIGQITGYAIPPEARGLNIKPASIGYQRIPMIDYVRAGAWTGISDPYMPGDAYEWLMTDLNLSDVAFALEIKGDSMLPDFKEGDRVIIDPLVSPQPGDFVVAKNGDQEATFKKYRPRGTNERGELIFELVPLNDDYPSMRSDITPIEIVGTMVEHRRYRRR
jgi:SOS-response transcriptional repressor LexA